MLGGLELLRGDTHDSSALERVIGSVVPGSARIEDGKGIATVRLTSAKGSVDTVQKIAEGSIRNISVGYWVHASEEAEVAGFRTITATDWEPLELSAVPVLVSFCGSEAPGLD